jgi:hypothetical protein
MNESQHFGREFVRFPRPSFVRHQGRQSSLLEGSLRLVKGGTGKPEVGSRLAYRVTVVLHTPQHFVLDLDEIAGIEEIVGPE